jgi:hypothetical protein
MIKMCNEGDEAYFKVPVVGTEENQESISWESNPRLHDSEIGVLNTQPQGSVIIIISRQRRPNINDAVTTAEIVKHEWDRKMTINGA